MCNKTGSAIFYIVIFLFVTHFCWTQNIAPVLTATGNQAYCPLSQINIVTDFNVVDPDDTEIDALFVQISTGYTFGEDSLTLLGIHPNIITSWNASEGKLTLSGMASVPVRYIDLIAAIKNVVFQSTSNNPSDKVFSITIGDANFLPSTGHYYEFVPFTGITWTDAKVAAEARTYFGLQGYLATITSSEEAQLSGEQAAGAGWIGGSDAETEGTWKWVTGPETGTIFWYGLSNGYTPNFSFWNTNEPNQAGNEDYAHVTAPGVGIPGSWNDLSNTGETSGDYQPKGYIVEYGGLPGDPVLNISASTSVYTNSIIGTSPAFRCGDGMVTLEAIPFKGTVLWFNDATGGTPISSGNTFSIPVLNSTTTYYVLASANGCIEGERTPVIATVYKLPVIQPSIVFKNCDEDGVPDGFTDFNLNEANDVITNNVSSGLTITFYMLYNEADMGINPINSIYNNSNGNTVYARIENTDGCYEVSTVNLQVSTTAFPMGYLQELITCDDDNIIDGIHVFDLTQASSMFISQFPSGQNLSAHYYKNLVDAQLEQNEILSQSNYINETPFSEVLYVRVESDDNGDCFGVGPNLLLTVHPRPEFEVEQTEVYCSNNIPVTLRSVNSNGDFNYEWKDEKGQVVSNLPIATVSGGTFTVVATSNFGCESYPVSVKVIESAVATIGLDDLTIVELTDNNSIKINSNNLGIGDYEFALDDSFGPYQDQPFFDRVSAGVHMLYVKDKNKCGIAELEIFILGFPKFFTPNNDGNNDTWQIQGLGTDFSDASVVRVFDRYGKFIKELNAKNGAWDGTFNGQYLPDSDYWFIANLIHITGKVRTLRGHFSLVR